ncbi:MAG: hypothetical protein ACNS61_05545 [Candidatus Wenzhouxiangella sp. M2_3B_020]
MLALSAVERFIAGISTGDIVLWTVYLVLFGLGFALPIFACYGLPLGMRLGEALGNACWKVATYSYGAAVVNQRPDDEYEVVETDEDSVANGRATFWSRFAGTRFGVTYDRVADAFGDYALPEGEYPPQVGAGVVPDGGVAKIAEDSVRGGVGQFVDTSISDPANKVWVEAADKLEELQGAAELDIAESSLTSALVEFGGDTSEYSPATMLVGSFLFLLAGVVLSFVVVF